MLTKPDIKQTMERTTLCAVNMIGLAVSPKSLRPINCGALLWSSGGLLIKLVDWSPLAIAGTQHPAALTIFLLTGKQLRFNWTAIRLAGRWHTPGQLLFVLAPS